MHECVLNLPLAFSLRTFAWWALWFALAGSAVLLAVLWRTRLRHAETWKKCAVLSLWLHVVLACIAMTVRMFAAGGPGLGDGEELGPPIRVALIAEETTEFTDETPPTAMEVADESEPPETPAEQSPTAVESPPEVIAPSSTTNDDKLSFDAPDLLALPTPPAEPTPAQAEVPAAEEPATVAETIADSAAAAQAATASEPDASSTPSAKSQPPATLDSPYADRFADNREQLVAGRGGDERTETAVRRALAWLAQSQSPDGRWNAARYGAGQERRVLGEDRGGAGAKADTGISALALLALLGAGHTHQQGPYADNVDHGLRFLRDSQQADGNLCGQAELFARMYCHSMASFALSEAYAITHDQQLMPAVRAAASYSLAVQHPVDGGWRYRPGDRGDTSQLGWQVMALKSAEVAGFRIPANSWSRIEQFLRNVERGDFGGLAAYRPEGPASRTMTAEALYCRELLAERGGAPLSAATQNEAIKSLLAEPPSAELVNLYYWYYATLALHHGQFASAEAEQAWREWNRSLVAVLLAAQKADGSFPETCLWGGYGGRVYATALSAMCLEVYYRYAPGSANPAAGGDVAQRRSEWRTVPQR